MAEEVPQAVLDALAPLPAGYRELFRRLLQGVEPDQRVRLVELSGSVGRGTADAGSDLDVVLGVEETSYDGFCGGWREWLAAVTPTVIAREIPGLSGAYYSVTPQCLRFDVVLETAGPR